MRLVTTVRIAVAFAFVGVVAHPASAFNLTGHWIGKYSCKGFDGAKFTSGNKTSTLDVTQTGATIAAMIDANVSPPDGSFHYNGIAIPDDKNADKGEAILLGCHLANTPAPTNTTFDGELSRLSVKTKTGTFKATITASSIFEDATPEVSQCKYSYKRIDTNDPGIAACP